MMVVAIVACAVALIMALVRTALGPTAFDRVLAVNAIGTIVILGIALHGFIMERPEFVDISLLYAILNFIGTFAVLKIFSTGSRACWHQTAGEQLMNVLLTTASYLSIGLGVVALLIQPRACSAARRLYGFTLLE